MFDVEAKGMDSFLSFRQGAGKFVDGVLGRSGGWCCFGGTIKADNGLFGFIRYLTDVGHGGGNTVKGAVLEICNFLLDTVPGGEDLFLHGFDVVMNVKEGGRGNLAVYLVIFVIGF